ncbi:hypothetical protein BAY13_17185 [Elizabethkingia bruuniana]|uniref:peroxiredoxin-like family protein n=1 Tax=Elizabethkingia bruuniana TaxID=1756149 RepID=UPI00099AEE23|nr:peroxiredoxin-like family protein [Elizabethkingia bruuniana]OPC66468.1 hypothetical protein BAY13_17185 [Elizabethkingia bruuniana]
MQATTDKGFVLEPRLKKIRDWAETNLTREDNETMERHIQYLRETGAVNNILKKGDMAPIFNLKNQRGEIISSADFLKKGNLVVSFYRGSWCPYCVEEVKVLNSVYPQIVETGADLVVISPQSFSKTEKQANELHLQYNVLVDKDNNTGKAFGLVYEFPEYLKSFYQERFNNNIQEINESSAWELPIPARFIIGTDGKILDVQAEPDYRFRPEPVEIVNFLKELNK